MIENGNRIDLKNLSRLRKRQRNKLKSFWDASSQHKHNIFVAGLFFVNDNQPLFVSRKREGQLQTVIPGGKLQQDSVPLLYDKAFYKVLRFILRHHKYSNACIEAIIAHEEILYANMQRNTIERFLIIEFLEETGLYPYDFVFAHKLEYQKKAKKGSYTVHNLYFWVLTVCKRNSVENKKLKPSGSVKKEECTEESLDKSIVDPCVITPFNKAYDLLWHTYKQPFKEICGIRSTVDHKFKEECYG